MTTVTTAATPARKPLYTSLFVQVLTALLLGIVLGMAVPDFAIGLKIFSDAFLKPDFDDRRADRVLRGRALASRAPATLKRSGGSAVKAAGLFRG